MGREIKFRAWDKRAKNYVKLLKLYFGSNGHLLGAQVEDYEHSHAYELKSKDIFLEQYTGLEDKNGKEIYENCELDGRYRVEYIAPKFVGKDMVSKIHENKELLGAKND